MASHGGGLCSHAGSASGARLRDLRLSFLGRFLDGGLRRGPPSAPECQNQGLVLLHFPQGHLPLPPLHSQGGQELAQELGRAEALRGRQHQGSQRRAQGLPESSRAGPSVRWARAPVPAPETGGPKPSYRLCGGLPSSGSLKAGPGRAAVSAPQPQTKPVLQPGAPGTSKRESAAPPGARARTARGRRLTGQVGGLQACCAPRARVLSTNTVARNPRGRHGPREAQRGQASCPGSPSLTSPGRTPA